MIGGYQHTVAVWCLDELGQFEIIKQTEKGGGKESSERKRTRTIDSIESNRVEEWRGREGQGEPFVPVRIYLGSFLGITD